MYIKFQHLSSSSHQNRPIVYRSRTVFEDATPEMVRDFFWDDEFRTKWDPMLTYFKILDECPHTGTMIVHWIKKVCRTRENPEYICCIIPLTVLEFMRVDASLYFPFLQFPFFCSDREYVMGRRIWEAAKTYYCVTKVDSTTCSRNFLLLLHVASYTFFTCSTQPLLHISIMF